MTMMVFLRTQLNARYLSRQSHDTFCCIGTRTVIYYCLNVEAEQDTPRYCLLMQGERSLPSVGKVPILMGEVYKEYSLNLHNLLNRAECSHPKWTHCLTDCSFLVRISLVSFGWGLVSRISQNCNFMGNKQSRTSRSEYNNNSFVTTSIM